MSGTGPEQSGVTGHQIAHEHAVEKGQIKHLSVSQLKTAALCERRWWFDKVKHFAEETTKALETGTAVHKQLEHYLRTGEDVLGPIALTMKRFLPEPELALDPGRTLLLEQDLGLLTAAGIPFVGQIDRVSTLGLVRVTDYKTSSNIEEYGAYPTQLATIDLEAVRGKGVKGAPDAGYQMVGYAVEILRRPQFRHEKVIELEHLLGPTSSKSFMAARQNPIIKMGAQFAHDQWGEKVEPLAERLKQHAQAEDMNDVPPNWNGCGKYGWKGCPHRFRCEQNELKQALAGKTMGIFDNLKKTGSSTVQPPAPSAAVSTPAPAPAVQTATAPVEVVKFEKPVAPPPVIAAITPSVSAPAELPAETASAAITPLEEKPKRPRKAKDEGGLSPEDRTELAVLRAAQFKPCEPTLRLFVDCLPNAPAQPLAGYVAGLVAKLETDFKVADIRNAPKKFETGTGAVVDHPLAYGGWKGSLAAMVKANPPAPGVYCVLGAAGNELVSVVVDTLEPLCAPGAFVRGVRA